MANELDELLHLCRRGSLPNDVWTHHEEYPDEENYSRKIVLDNLQLARRNATNCGPIRTAPKPMIIPPLERIRSRLPEVMLQIYSFLPLHDRIWTLALISVNFASDKVRSGYMKGFYGKRYWSTRLFVNEMIKRTGDPLKTELKNLLKEKKQAMRSKSKYIGGHGIKISTQCLQDLVEAEEHMTGEALNGYEQLFDFMREHGYQTRLKKILEKASTAGLLQAELWIPSEASTL